MRITRLLQVFGLAACCAAPTLAEDPVNIGDIAHGLSATAANTGSGVRQIRGGIQHRDIRLSSGGPIDPFPGSAAAPRGAWTTQAFLQSMEFDNANGFSHNARGNLLALNFGSVAGATPIAERGGQLFALSTNGSNTISPVLFQFNAANTSESVPQRTGGLCVSPDNQHVAGTFFETGRVWLLDYNAGSAIGTGTGVSFSGLSKSAPVNTIAHTFGTTFQDNDTIIVVYTNIAVTTVATIDFDPATNVFAAPVVRSQFQPFDNSGNSRFTDVEYNPAISPYVYVLYSLFSGSTTNKLTVIDPSTWAVINTIDLSATIGTSRECALGPDRQLYVAQFSNDSQNTTYVDVIRLDLNGNGTIDLADTNGLTNDAASNHSSRLPYPATSPLDFGASFSGLDVAIAGPLGTGGPEVTGACCLAPAGCLSAITAAACTQFGGTYQGNNSTCSGCPLSTGACCDVATGACTTVDFVTCFNQGQLYYGEGSVCTATACEGPGACCLTNGTCVSARPRDCYYNLNGFFRGIGTLCSAVVCPSVPPVATTFDFDSANPLPHGRNLSFVPVPDLSASTPPGSFTDAGGQSYPGSDLDVFGIVNRAVNTDFADDSNGILPQDTFGVIYTAKVDNFFGVEDLFNSPEGGTGNGTATATWTFDIASLTNLAIQIDAVSLGNFEDTNIPANSIADTFNFTFSIDGGTPQPLFTSDILEPVGNVTTFTYGIMEQGTRISYIGGESLQDPVAINGIQLRNDFVRFLAPVAGTGSVLTIRFTATSNGAQEVFAFDNLTVRANGGAVNGACCRGATCGSETMTACTGPNSSFAGASTVCNIFPSNLSPCCFADYNHQGGITVQDIFDFLAGYFSGSPAADINGGGISVQDIFDYLSAYFAGGC